MLSPEEQVQQAIDGATTHLEHSKYFLKEASKAVDTIFLHRLAQILITSISVYEAQYIWPLLLGGIAFVVLERQINTWDRKYNTLIESATAETNKAEAKVIAGQAAATYLDRDKDKSNV